jgi:hypothetical protein
MRMMLNASATDFPEVMKLGEKRNGVDERSRIPQARGACGGVSRKRDDDAALLNVKYPTLRTGR